MEGGDGNDNGDEIGSLADDDDTAAETISYMETSDGLGRKYVCRVYHEDALDPSSVTDSMFDTPILKTRQGSRGDDYDTEDSSLNNEEEDEEEASLRLLERLGLEAMEEGDELEDISADILLMETQRRLKKLEGVCSQIHLGWWSYEWCYDRGVTQFHIHVDNLKSLELRDVTALGTFSKRKFQIPSHPEESDPDDDDFPAANKYAGDELELSRVVDSYANGETCEATGEPRHTKVKYFCCSERLMQRYKSPVLRNGSPVSSKAVSIVSLVEDPDEVCSYTITICTPLLCEDVKSDDDDGLLYDIGVGSMLKKSSSSASAASSSTKASLLSKNSKRVVSKPRKENETIRDILDRTMGKACIQSSTSGWWSYEYCHQKHVRQFHESISINVDTGMATATSGDEDIYYLGYYSEELDSYPEEDEWKYVVNRTLSTSGSGGDGGAPSGSSAGSGGGQTVAAYFTTEYVGGNVCDDAEVTDAAIKAGTVRSGHIERSSSVRFACGQSFDIYVNEDHTCHYIVDVTVPDLCHHPAFKAPVAKKQVVKCLLVEDTNEG